MAQTAKYLAVRRGSMPSRVSWMYLVKDHPICVRLGDWDQFPNIASGTTLILLPWHSAKTRSFMLLTRGQIRRTRCN